MFHNGLRKCFVVMLFGKPIPWLEQYKKNTASLSQYGWDWLILQDLEWFKSRVRKNLGIEPALNPNTTKYWDYRPFLGEILKEELDGYDFWGHTDHDVVYGRLDRWVTDELLSNTDVFSNDPKAMCGFFSLYKNTPKTNRLFENLGDWQSLLTQERVFVLDEIAMTDVMLKEREKNTTNWVDRFWQGNDKKAGTVKLLEDGTLLHNDQEIMAYHFKETKKWPL